MPRTPSVVSSNALRGSLFAAGVLFACAGGTHPITPSPVRDTDWSRVSRFLDSIVADGAAPGAVLGVSRAGHRFYYGTGRLGQEDATRPDSTTLYDLASLTKVIGLTSALMFAVEDARLELDAPVRRYLPAFTGPGKAGVTIRQLLTHSSGLPAWRPLYKESSSRSTAFALVDSTALDTVPGTRFVYSDLGTILLTQVVESLYGERIDSLLARRLFQPLGMGDTRYLPPTAWLPRMAPTENDPWRGRVLRGEVHDENASRLDGVSGHAGLFSDAVDLLRFGEALLWAGRRNGGTADESGPAPSAVPLSRRTVLEFTRRQNLPPGSSRALGWDTPSEGSSGGTRLSAGSFGHTGFTGTSIWIDPGRDLVIVLLSNRVHPTRENKKWGPVRGQVADLVVDALFPSGS